MNKFSFVLALLLTFFKWTTHFYKNWRQTTNQLQDSMQKYDDFKSDIEKSWQHVELQNWVLIVAMGSMAAIGQLLMTKAFQLASPVQIGLLTYSSVIFAAILGFYFWQEPISAGLILGTILIIIAANITIRQKWL